jgi:hypothetical protein
MVKEIIITGRGDRVTVIEMLEANGDRATMTITGEKP